MSGIIIASEIPAVLRFSRDAIYTFRTGPNAGRALRYVGPADPPLQDEYVKVVTADGQLFDGAKGRQMERREAVCKPEDLVLK